MAKFIDTNDDKAIIDFNNMTFKQFRYLVKEAARINEEAKMQQFSEYNNYYDEHDVTNIGDR